MATPESDSDSPAETAPQSGFPVVALGASAGGLDALDRFFSSLGSLPGAAFVVIQHLAPEHRTMMDTLLGRHTDMPVTVAEDRGLLEPGHVYVIPPGTTMRLQGDRVRLEPRATSGITLPVDTFFESLATERPDGAVGIVLSGTGSDGTRGALVLARAGAWVLAQEPATARFDGMPLNAIATGVTDAVLSPENLAGFVRDIVESGRIHPGRDPMKAILSGDISPESAVGLLRTFIPVDLNQYKPTTVLRRLERRMQAADLPSLQEYAAHLRSDPEEVDRLRTDLLISVTRFFRDPEAFQALRTQYLEGLLADEDREGPIRVWVAGCSSGQEAYSVAILLHEVARDLGVAPHFKIFATDVEASYVERAARGTYPDAGLEELDPEIRDRWFHAGEDGRWQVDAALRQCIVFSRHDLLADAPFTRLDLVVCRNLLIYLKAPAQARALRRLSYGLKAGGALFLGSSESLGEVEPLYEVVNARQKLYRLVRRPSTLPPEDLLSGAASRRRRHGLSLMGEDSVRRSLDTPDRATAALLGRYAPPSLVITPERELVHLFGEVQRFLRFMPGHASLDVLQLLPHPLLAVVATLVHAVTRDQEFRRSAPVELDQDGESVTVSVAVAPLPGEGARVEQLLVSFEAAEAPPGDPAPSGSDDLAAMSSRQVAELERELALTRVNLHETIQDLGTANEELQATNEELMASNEELQSTNEELQSVNEELHTLNAEYQAKISQLNEANADLESLTRAPGIPLVFLDGELNLVRFTPAATEIFRLRQADTGRPITDFSHNLDHRELYEEIARAADTRRIFREEIRDRDGRAWLITAVPHMTRDGSASRIVIACVDVSSMRDVQRLQGVMDALPEHIAVLDRNGVIQLVNRSWREFAERNGDAECVTSGPGVNYLQVCRDPGAGDDQAREALQGIAGVLDRSLPGFVHRYPCHSPEERRWFVMYVSPLEGGGCVISHFNITGWLDEDRPAAASFNGGT